MADPKKGDRVRVTYEGTFKRFDGCYGHVTTDEGEVYCPLLRHVEVIEPEYQAHAIYKSKYGHAYIRTTNDKWRCLANGNVFDHEEMYLPMTKMKLVADDA